MHQLPPVDDFLKALASETRQRILFQAFQAGQERTVGQVAELMGIGQSTASEHLAIMRRGGLLQSRREGKEVYYRPDRRQVLGMMQHLTDQLASCCPVE